MTRIVLFPKTIIKYYKNKKTKTLVKNIYEFSEIPSGAAVPAGAQASNSTLTQPSAPDTTPAPPCEQTPTPTVDPEPTQGKSGQSRGSGMYYICHAHF